MDPSSPARKRHVVVEVLVRHGRRRDAVLAEHLGRAALHELRGVPDRRLARLLTEQRVQVRVRVEVDESRGENEPCTVHHFRLWVPAVSTGPDRGDAATTVDGDICGDGVGARPVEQRRAAHHEWPQVITIRIATLPKACSCLRRRIGVAGRVLFQMGRTALGGGAASREDGERRQPDGWRGSYDRRRKTR